MRHELSGLDERTINVYTAIVHAQAQKQVGPRLVETPSLDVAPFEFVADFLAYAERAHAEGWLPKHILEGVREAVEAARQRHGREG